MLSCRNIEVRFGDFVALDDVTIEVSEGSRLSIVGPSGCGKSTLLRTIVGLEPPVTGRVTWRGEDLGSLAPHERRIGLMFQEHALFPHRSVGANVAFGLQMRGEDAASTTKRTDDLLELVGLSSRRESHIDELSGGERQRVALARTLATEPKLILLDEPLASLDRVLRTELLDEMTSILDELRITAIAVTHDLDEAFRFGDHLAVMSPGRIERWDAVDRVWDDPQSEFAARFLGYSPVALRTAFGFDPGVGADTDMVAIAPDGFAFDPNGRIDATAVRSTFESGTWRHQVELSMGADVIVHARSRHEGAVRLSVDESLARVVQPTSSAV